MSSASVDAVEGPGGNRMTIVVGTVVVVAKIATRKIYCI